jgi:LysR family transcriptional activator of nhaA
MKSSNLNLHHLYYFWVVANEGSMTRAAERLDLAVQTISTQLTNLEKSMGKSLLTQQGRRLVLTDAGRTMMAYADQIFLLAEQMQDALKNTHSVPRLHLTVGISDVVPKLLANRLLEPVWGVEKPIRLICHEGKYESLLADLALHKLDLVLTDRPPHNSSSLRLFGHSLGTYEISLFGTPALVQQYQPGFPQSLQGAPLLLPTRINALRMRLDHWFDSQQIRPDIVGEFQDSALQNTFGRNGKGMFPAPTVLADDILSQFGAAPVGQLQQVQEEFFAISNERKIQHPALEKLLPETSRTRPEQATGPTQSG